MFAHYQNTFKLNVNFPKFNRVFLYYFIIKLIDQSKSHDYKNKGFVPWGEHGLPMVRLDAHSYPARGLYIYIDDVAGFGAFQPHP